ncbi:MAG TPA: agmatinase [Streptosporangiaceae bacterium]
MTESRTGRNHVGPVDASTVPRYSGIATFARLPSIDVVDRADVAVAGVPFDAGTSFRPGARFGPAAVREASRLLRPYDPALRLEPFELQQVVDAGDLSCNPFSIPEAIEEIYTEAAALLQRASRLLALGGDHTIAFPLLKAVAEQWGPVALVHFDAHLDTWDSYFNAPYTHGTPFRRAREQGYLLDHHSVHVGLRGPLYAESDLADDEQLGFMSVHATDLDRLGVQAIIERIRDRVADAPVYVSVDIDVLDPAHAPGTGTPEPGGLTSRELLSILRGLAGTRMVGADVVEVSPPFDHASLTALAAAHVAYALLGITATTPAPARGSEASTQQPAPAH